MDTESYPSDLTDKQWRLIEPLLPLAKPGGGRPREVDMRRIIDGVLYLNRSGCAWRMLPRDFGPWSTVHGYYRDFRRADIWQGIHDKLREKVRVAVGKEPTPSAAILDSQTVKTAKRGTHGYDAGKKITGRKRHIVVDTLGLILVVVVHAACIQDRDGGKLALAELSGKFPRLKLIWADGGYAGQLVAWTKDLGGWLLEIVRRNANLKGFVVLPKRWIVERTFAWLGKYRRLSKDYETLTDSSRAMIHIAMINLMAHRLKSEK